MIEIYFQEYLFCEAQNIHMNEGIGRALGVRVLSRMDIFTPACTTALATPPPRYTHTHLLSWTVNLHLYEDSNL